MSLAIVCAASGQPDSVASCFGAHRLAEGDVVTVEVYPDSGAGLDLAVTGGRFLTAALVKDLVCPIPSDRR